MVFLLLQALTILSYFPSEKMNEKPLIVYEVFVQSFRDSNQDGIGDLPGLISKLDYIKDLGANAVWITPIHPSPSYHKYDVVDYYGIHPDFGTMDDFEKLVKELHQRDMKLIFDLVINHTSAEHPWFIESSSSKTNPYHDYYVWKNYAAVQDEINKKETTFDSDNPTQWHAGGTDADDRYYGFFWKGMPDLNFDNPKVRKEVYKIGKFWLDKGVDGFRLDAARHIFPDDQMDDTRMFWEEFTDKMRSYKPDVKIIGEVWSDPKTLTTLFKGLPSLFNFQLSKMILDVVQNGNAARFNEDYTTLLNTYAEANVPFEDAILLSNHDMNRIRSLIGGDIEKSKLAASILLTLPGTPYIYYGEEIGMLGQKPDENIREPFLWGDDSFQKKCWMVPTNSIQPHVVPLSEQMNDPKSIFNHYKKWIQLRKDHPTLATGKWEPIETINGLLVYRISGEQKLAAVHNLTDQDQFYSFIGKMRLLSTNTLKSENEKVMIGPYQSALLELFEE